MYAKVGVNYIAKAAYEDKLSYLAKVFVKNILMKIFKRTSNRQQPG